MPQKMNETYEITEDNAAVLLGAIPGVYDVWAEDYGWGDGDLYVMAPMKIKVRHLKIMETNKQ